MSISLILAGFAIGGHHFLWGRILKTGHDYKKDGDKEYRRLTPRLYLALTGEEEKTKPEARVPHALWRYPGG